MLETIASTCRAVAADARLVILHELAHEEELSGKEIAARARLPACQASRHLARLTGVGLVRVRRSGRRVFYALASQGGEPLSSAFIRLIQRACTNVRWATKGWDEKQILHLSARTASHLPRAVARLLDVVFDAATAFGNVRRLLILRLLVRGGPCECSRLRSVLSMSPRACERQLDKLRRRGYVTERSAGVWAPSSRYRSGFHSALLGIVVRHLR